MKWISAVLLLALYCSHNLAQSKGPRRLPDASPASATTPHRPTTLPIRRVVLYSNGVGFFERRGAVAGSAAVNLSFKQSQVDDVLKSMVVLDLGKGRIGAVSYNSSAPSSARLSEIPFSIAPGSADETTGGGLVGVLQQLQGARVRVTTATRTAAGSILTVEERGLRAGGKGDEAHPHRFAQALVIASENGDIAKFDLDEIRAVKILDEGARHDIAEFADASAAARRRDAKTITVTSEGAGEREMSVSYTVAAPIWKTTYRIVVDAQGKPFFQGWAIVDNVGDEDWSDVQLSLVSGTPISFIQPIQQPLYRYRPVIALPDDLQLTPQTYEPPEAYSASGISGLPRSVSGGVAGGVPGGIPGGTAAGAGVGEPPPPPPEPKTSLSDLLTGADSGIQAAASGKEVGDLFAYHIDQPVTVRRNRSALIPILQTRLEGERVSLYNEAARRDRPLSGLRVKNTSPLTLEGGSLTVIDGDAYAGETLMERLKPNEERFISFALDLGTLVSTQAKADRTPTFLVRIVNGVFQSHYYRTEKKIYTITNQTDRPRVVYVEHPVRAGWSLSEETEKPVEKSASFYRFRIEIPARRSVELPVTERQTLMETYALADFTPRYLEILVTNRYVDEATRALLEKVLDVKDKIALAAEQIRVLEREGGEISADQMRLRENIKALKDTPETKDLITRYVGKAGEQETRLEQIAREKRAATADRNRLQEEHNALIRSLSFTRKL